MENKNNGELELKMQKKKASPQEFGISLIQLVYHRIEDPSLNITDP